MRASSIGYIAAFLATALWAGNFIAARALAEQIPPCQFNFWRWVIALVGILPFAVRSLKQDFDVIRHHWRYLSLMAFIGVTLMNTFIYKAGQTTESLNMALLMPAAPVVVLVLSRFVYGERISVRRFLGMLSALAGVGILLSRGNLQRLLDLQLNSGDLWTLLCMLSFAVYSLFMRQRPREISPLAFNVAVFALGIVYALPCVALEAWFLPMPSMTPELVAGLTYVGLGCSAAAFWLWTVGIDRIGPVRASFIYYSLPVFAGIGSVLILDETVQLAQVVGGILIVGGICLATLPHSVPSHGSPRVHKAEKK